MVECHGQGHPQPMHARGHLDGLSWIRLRAEGVAQLFGRNGESEGDIVHGSYWRSSFDLPTRSSEPYNLPYMNSIVSSARLAAFLALSAGTLPAWAQTATALSAAPES